MASSFLVFDLKPAFALTARTITVRDDMGREVVVPWPARRVAAFNRYTDEFLRAIGGIGVIAGIEASVLKERAYWPRLEHTPVIGEGQTGPNFEAIVALKPDVVFFPRNSDWEKAAKVLGTFHIPVVVLTAWDAIKHEENVSLLGRILDRPAEAAKLNAFYRHYRDVLAERLKGVARKRVYMEEVRNYSTLLKGSGWHDMCELGGGINVFDDVDVAHLPAGRGSIQGFDVDPEEIVARNPDIIVKLEPGQYEPHTRAFSAEVLNGIAARPGFAQMKAVKSGQVYNISYYYASGCSKIVGAVQIAKWLYPDHFADVSAEEAMRVWLEDFQGVPSPGSYWVSLAQLRQ